MDAKDAYKARIFPNKVKALKGIAGGVKVERDFTAGAAFLNMLGVFAEFETALRKERQMDGIAKAKASGVYKGRKATIDPAAVKSMMVAGKGPSEIAKALKIGRASVYRVLKNV